MRTQAYWVTALLIVAGVITAFGLRSREARALEPGMSVASGPPTGANCEVFLRRDYLATYIKEETSGLQMQDKAGNYRWEKSVTGTLETLNDSWVAVRRTEAGTQVWIPRAAVLAIEMGKR